MQGISITSFKKLTIEKVTFIIYILGVASSLLS